MNSEQMQIQVIEAGMPLPQKVAGAFRILLFSDLHLAVPVRWRQLHGKQYLGALNQFFNRNRKLHPENLEKLASLLPDLSPDLLLCGGDLTSISLPSEFQLAKRLLRPLLDWAGKERFIYLPGNHDCYVDTPVAREALEESFAELNHNRWSLQDFPVSYSFPCGDLFLLHLARPNPFYLSNGVVTEPTLQKLESLLSQASGQNRIICSHFPLYSAAGKVQGGLRGLENGEKLASLLQRQKVNFLLAGHEHKGYGFSSPQIGTQVVSGSLTMENRFAVVDCFGDGRGSQVNLVRLSA